MMERKVIRKIKTFEQPGVLKVDQLARMMEDTSKGLDDVELFLRETYNFISLRNERKNMRKVTQSPVPCCPCRIASPTSFTQVAIWTILRATRLFASGIGAVAYRRWSYRFALWTT